MKLSMLELRQIWKGEFWNIIIQIWVQNTPAGEDRSRLSMQKSAKIDQKLQSKSIALKNFPEKKRLS